MDLVEKCLDPFRVRVRENIINPVLGGARFHHAGNQPFTILSNNCWAGHVYRYFSQPYDTPTIGLYFFAPDYIRFLSDLKRYVEIDLGFIKENESKYSRILKQRNHGCPIGLLDDVEIVFLHYKSEEEAYEKWKRRCDRIHWDRLFCKFSEQNFCSQNDLRDFDQLDYKHKFVFTSQDYGLKSQIEFKEFHGTGEVSNDALHFNKYINLEKWINGKDDFRK